MKQSILKNKMTVIIGILCFIGSACIIGYTYSFFTAEVSDAVTIKGDAASPSVNLTISRVAPTEDKKLIPQLDAVIHKAVIGTQGNCLDDNNNAVCQVYKITVTSTSTVATYVSGTIELDAKDNPHLKWAEVSGLSNTTLVSDTKTYEDIVLIDGELYEGGEAKDYYIVLWISETGAPQTDSGSFNGIVTIENIASNPSIISNPAAETLAKLGITPEDEILTAFTTNSDLDGTIGVYETEDDLGRTYYFRGDVTNNYVKFGKYPEDAYQIVTLDETTEEYVYSYNSACPSSYIKCTQIAEVNDDMYWRIVRINGDGSIRMIYEGTKALKNNDYQEHTHIGVSLYNKNYNDNAYVGYMYGTPGSTTYEETHENINDSDLKRTIDAWYAKYLNTNYDSYIADAIYCNNRTITNNDLLNEVYGATNEGFGTNTTLYDFLVSLYLDEDANAGFSHIPSLICKQENDRFTKNINIGTVIGTGKLTYPVAAITADEVIFAGNIHFLADFDSNPPYSNNIYLGTSYPLGIYSTMTPYYFFDSQAFVNIYMKGITFRNYVSNGEFTQDGLIPIVNPVISLKSTAITGGTGIITNPFTVG